MYRTMLLCGDVSQLAVLHGRAIGAIGCRLELFEGGNGQARLYILTLGVLPSARGVGIGAHSMTLYACKLQCDTLDVCATIACPALVFQRLGR